VFSEAAFALEYRAAYGKDSIARRGAQAATNLSSN
jgi:hypothetical protein